MPAQTDPIRLAVALAALAAAPLHAEPPPRLVEEAEEAFAVCSEFGGTARILDGYRTEADLNGDGIADYVTDLSRMECGGAWSAFCGSGGCPVAAWLSEPDGRYSRFDLGLLQNFEILVGSGGDLPVLRASYHGAFCDTAATGPAGCTRSWVFDSNAPARPAVDVSAQPPGRAPGAEVASAATPDAAPRPSILPDAAPGAAEPVPPGWTLRRVPGSSPVALGGGTGRIASLAAFCLQGVPFLAVGFADPPEEELVTIGFAFSQGEVAQEAAYEETAGGAYVMALDTGALGARLAGSDSAVVVRVDDAEEGVLSLDGSTSAIRAALAECHRF